MNKLTFVFAAVFLLAQVPVLASAQDGEIEASIAAGSGYAGGLLVGSRLSSTVTLSAGLDAQLSGYQDALTRAEAFHVVVPISLRVAMAEPAPGTVHGLLRVIVGPRASLSASDGFETLATLGLVGGVLLGGVYSIDEVLSLVLEGGPVGGIDLYTNGTDSSFLTLQGLGRIGLILRV